MFDSLYDNGKIVINRKYFRHILAATSLWSTSTYSEHLSSLELTVWKFRLFRRFYRRRRAEGGITGPGIFAVAFRVPPASERSRRVEVPDSVPQRRRQRPRDCQVQTAARLDVKARGGSVLRALGRHLPRDPREEHSRRHPHARTRRYSSAPRDQCHPAVESRAWRPPPHPGQGDGLALQPFCPALLTGLMAILVDQPRKGGRSTDPCQLPARPKTLDSYSGGSYADIEHMVGGRLGEPGRSTNEPGCGVVDERF